MTSARMGREVLCHRGIDRSGQLTGRIRTCIIWTQIQHYSYARSPGPASHSRIVIAVPLQVQNRRHYRAPTTYTVHRAESTSSPSGLLIPRADGTWHQSRVRSRPGATDSRITTKEQAARRQVALFAPCVASAPSGWIWYARTQRQPNCSSLLQAPGHPRRAGTTGVPGLDGMGWDGYLAVSFQQETFSFRLIFCWLMAGNKTSRGLSCAKKAWLGAASDCISRKISWAGGHVSNLFRTPHTPGPWSVGKRKLVAKNLSLCGEPERERPEGRPTEKGKNGRWGDTPHPSRVCVCAQGSIED